MSERGLLHAVIDALPDEALDEVSRYLAAHCDHPVLRALLLAPPEDEELSSEEIAMLEAARADRATGSARYISDEELARRIGG
ncbi:MAG TPA: hypothetical protein VFE37_28590 [Chloroflexota bacterium]|nr:hypothetical protein [Chloroflexota bacterium]